MQPDPGSPTPPLRVVVVDADDRVRESLTRLLRIGDRVEVVGSAGQSGPALDVVMATDPDVVVVDPRLPEVDGGLAFIRRLRSNAPGVRVLVMSGSDTPRLAELSGSCDGVVRKTFRANDLLTAILGAGLLVLL
jgi:two-component system, NarL family, response regulator DevR